MKLEEIKNKTNEAVNHLIAALEAGQSEVLTQYLNAMARFHNYSFGNVMLIARQKPQATNVAGIHLELAWPLRQEGRKRHPDSCSYDRSQEGGRRSGLDC